MALRIVFMGTPDFSVPVLEALVRAGHDVCCAYTQPARPGGRRGLETVPAPVAKAAEKLGIEVRHPVSLKGEAEQAEFAALNADVAVVVAYGLLLPQAVLDAPKYGCFNGHASDLPRWRGAAPIQRAIMAGDRETALCVMKMEAGLDTGPVALREPVEITLNMTAGMLHDALAETCAVAMVEAMMRLETAAITLTPQPEDGVTYARKIEKAEARIDWNKPAEEVHNHIMGLSPFPGAWCEIDGVRAKVLESVPVGGAAPAGTVLDGLTIACGDGAVRLLRVQKAGGKTLAAEDFLRGTPVEPGTILA